MLARYFRLMVGFAVYALLMLAPGRGRQVTPPACVLAALFLARVAYRP